MPVELKLTPETKKRAGQAGLVGAFALFAGFIGQQFVQFPKSPAIVGGTTLGEIRVQVDGAVKKPGVYTFKLGQRVEDAIQAAGGPADSANLDGLNRSAKLLDAVAITIPSEGDAETFDSQSPYSTSFLATTPQPTKPGDTPELAAGTIAINTATQQELESLPGIGPSIASRILQFRMDNKGFKSIEDLDKVKGIGPKLMAKIRPFLRL